MTPADPKPNDAAMLDILKSTYLYKEKFSDDLLQSLLEKSSEIHLHAKDYLFRQGDPGDEMYIVISGLLKVTITDENGADVCVADIGHGEPVGEIQFLTGGTRTAGVFAQQDTRLLAFNRESMRPVVSAHPDFFGELNLTVRDRLRDNHLKAVLPRLFGYVDTKLLDFIKSNVEWRLLKKGERLFSQGETDDSFFVLMSGRLNVAIEDQLGNMKKIGVIRSGESVGEMGMISGESRTATIFAVRDSQLVKVGKSAFETIIDRYPRVAINFMKILVERTRQSHKSAHKQSMEVNFAILPAGPDLSIDAFSQRLGKALSKFGRVLHLSSQRLDTYWGMPEMSQASIDDPKYNRLSAWLDEQEAQYTFILYETDNILTNWTRRCLHQADHILIVGKSGDNPAPGEIEDGLYAGADAMTRPQASLIMLHPDDSRLPDGTRHWLEPRQLDFHHHVRWNKDGDFERVARFITGNAVGLVLGGGGARGFAHLGVIKALEESGIPIDMVCGTSIGSIMGAFCALGWDHDARMQKAKEYFVDINPIGDYTFPVISLVKSKIIDRCIKKGFGDVQIEDLWLNYFCVSANLTTSKLIVHDRGPLWKASRASISLPGILVPVLNQNCLLVDGGVINNLPADIMRERFGGFIMLVNVSPEQDVRMPSMYDIIPSAWAYIWSRLNPFKDKIVIPTILDIMMRTILLSSINQANRVKDDADHYFDPPIDQFGLLDFKSLNEISTAGYEYAKQEIEEWKQLSEELWEFKLGQCLLE
jgi:predicted acylesterase/phospholipase RssA/CRP-like cAMP-binding protein